MGSCAPGSPLKIGRPYPLRSGGVRSLAGRPDLWSIALVSLPGATGAVRRPGSRWATVGQREHPRLGAMSGALAAHERNGPPSPPRAGVPSSLGGAWLIPDSGISRLGAVSAGRARPKKRPQGRRGSLARGPEYGGAMAPSAVHLKSTAAGRADVAAERATGDTPVRLRQARHDRGVWCRIWHEMRFDAYMEGVAAESALSAE